MAKLFQWRKKPSNADNAPGIRAVDYMQRIDLFKDLTHPEVEEIFRGVMVRRCSPGTMFFTPDDPSERLFILKEGHVELYRLTADGKRLVTRQIGPGMVFGEMGLLGQTMHGCYAEATDDALVCTATRDDVLRLFHQRPDLAMRLLEIVGNRVRLLEARLEQTAFMPVRSRLANFLLDNADRSGMISGYTHADIGDIIGALRQTVTESLNLMQRQGLIDVGQKKIHIVDRRALETVVTESQAAP